MKCPHLVKVIVYTCVSVEDSYLPSGGQLRSYCKSKAHSNCPFFASSLTNARFLSYGT